MINDIKALLADAFDGEDFDFAALVALVEAIVTKIFDYIKADI